ncbi:DUF6770 family protein [Flavobacterium sp. GP15]|uniref:DUF6770 family protein n=1 Tax=Flavobacterium sp. GP15 TaxID=2758567 RepID=UPI00165E9C48|nr:DUF6770 family protein [Flavobacterium sp. GP15]
MKNTYLFFLFLLSTVSFAQSYAILNSADGELMTFQPIYEDKELFGYVELRQMNIDENLNNTIKYIVLDKNFNTICSGDFIEKTSNLRRKKRFNDITYSDGFIRLDFFEFTQALGENIYPYFKTYQVIDLKNNSIVSSGIYNSDVKEIDKKYEKIDTKGYYSYSLNNVGFLIQATDPNTKIKNEVNFLYALNFKNEKLWEYKSNVILKKNNYLQLSVLDYNSQNILLEEFTDYGNKKDIRNFVVLDTKTGKELFRLPIKGTFLLERENIYLKDEKIYEWGRFFEEEKKLLYHKKYLYATYEKYEKKSLGVFQRIIDIKSAQLIRDKYVKYSEFPALEINKNGKVKNKGFLTFQKCSSNPDGTFMILAESYWQKNQYRDYNKLYTFLIDEAFNPIKSVEYDVKRTRGYKYDFSQTLPNKTGRAYFFFDKNDDKDLELNILNYYYKSKKEVIQKIPITNDDSVISVFPAKTGYVAIAEYFKKPKKSGKLMEIRLEKLNYDRE